MNAHFRSAAIAAAILSCVLAAQTAHAGLTDDAKALMAQGQYAQALDKLDQQVARNPQDAEARFARGLALTRLGKTTEAIKAYTDLVRDYPKLPEPYNNLAVLYAKQGNYEKAQDALQAALAINPSYATGHENLGDIYTALAGAAYARALKLEPDSTALRGKIELINQLEQVPAGTSLARTPPPAVAPAAVAPPPAPVAAAVTPAAAPVASPATVDAGTTAAINAVLNTWAQAWSGKNLDAYFSVYGSGFVPDDGQSRAAWMAQRRERIEKAAHIKVTVSQLTLSRVAADRVRADFTQAYVSDSYSDTVDKSLDFQLDGEAWKIVRESAR